MYMYMYIYTLQTQEPITIGSYNFFPLPDDKHFFYCKRIPRVLHLVKVQTKLTLVLYAHVYV